MGGEYAGGAASSRSFGRLVGVVTGKGFVILLFATTGAAAGILEERDRDDDNDDLGSFFEVNRLRLKGMLLNLEDALMCEQKVGAGERVAILCDVWVQTWQERFDFLCGVEGRCYVTIANVCGPWYATSSSPPSTLTYFIYTLAPWHAV